MLSKVGGRSHKVVAYKEGDKATVNYMDAAIAVPLSDDLVSEEILMIGLPNGTAEAELNMRVKKFGRTSLFNLGKVVGLNAAARVSYGGDRVAYFDGQIITTHMADPGDSGSLVLTEQTGSPDDNRVVGLLFAGSDTATIVSPIGYIMDALGVVF